MKFCDYFYNWHKNYMLCKNFQKNMYYGVFWMLGTLGPLSVFLVIYKIYLRKEKSHVKGWGAPCDLIDCCHWLTELVWWLCKWLLLVCRSTDDMWLNLPMSLANRISQLTCSCLLLAYVIFVINNLFYEWILF